MIVDAVPADDLLAVGAAVLRDGAAQRRRAAEIGAAELELEKLRGTVKDVRPGAVAITRMLGEARRLDQLADWLVTLTVGDPPAAAAEAAGVALAPDQADMLRAAAIANRRNQLLRQGAPNDGPGIDVLRRTDVADDSADLDNRPDV